MIIILNCYLNLLGLNAINRIKEKKPELFTDENKPTEKEANDFSWGLFPQLLDKCLDLEKPKLIKRYERYILEGLESKLQKRLEILEKINQ